MLDHIHTLYDFDGDIIPPTFILCTIYGNNFLERIFSYLFKNLDEIETFVNLLLLWAKRESWELLQHPLE